MRESIAQVASFTAGPLIAAAACFAVAVLLWHFAALLTPGPTPEPVVAEKPDFIVAVTDSEHPTVQVAAILRDESLGTWLADHGVKFRVVDMHADEYRDDRYLADINDAKVTPPAALLYAKGKVIRAAKATELPTVAAVEAWVEGKRSDTGLVRWDDSAGSVIFDDQGELRRLNRLSPDQATLVRLKAVPRWADAKYLVAESNWVNVNRRRMFPPEEWILDQNGIGECVGCGGVGALRRKRLMDGMTDHKLSPGALYAQINGGRDNGAVIGDSLTAMMNVGVPLYDTVGIKPFYLHQLPGRWKDEAKRFKVDEAYTVPTWEEMVSAIQLGYTIVYGIEVGGNFQRFNADGVAGFSAGPGNHCMMADGCAKLPNGTWVLDNVNSWGTSWGPWKNGRCYLTQQHLSRAMNRDAYAIKSATLDPQEANRSRVKTTAKAGCPCSAMGLCPNLNCNCGTSKTAAAPPEPLTVPAWSTTTYTYPGSVFSTPQSCRVVNGVRICQ